MSLRVHHACLHRGTGALLRSGPRRQVDIVDPQHKRQRRCKHFVLLVPMGVSRRNIGKERAARGGRLPGGGRAVIGARRARGIDGLSAASCSRRAARRKRRMAVAVGHGGAEGAGARKAAAGR